MNKDWILQGKQTRRVFATATWVPLRASINDEKALGHVREIGYISEYFGCGSVAFPPEHRKVAERLSWSDIGIGHSARPYAYEDGHYSPIDRKRCSLFVTTIGEAMPAIPRTRNAVCWTSVFSLVKEGLQKSWR